MPPLKEEHERKAKERKEKNPKRRQQNVLEEAMSERETERQARQHLPRVSKPEKAHIPQSYDVEMASMEGWDQRYPQLDPQLETHGRHHGWGSKTGPSTTASHQTSIRRNRSNDGYPPSLQERNGKLVKGNGTSISAQHLPSPAIAHPSAPRPQYHQSPSNASRRKQIVGDTAGTRAVARITPYPENNMILDHRSRPSLPRSRHRSPSPRPSASVAPSMQRTVTVASSHRSRRRLEENHMPEVSPLSSYEDLSRLTPHERALVEPSICSSDHPPLPVIRVTPCSSGRKSIASGVNNGHSHLIESGETSEPRDGFKGQYGRWYSPSDAGYSEVARPRAGQAGTTDHTGDNEGYSLPGVRMIEAACPPPYERETDSKVWDWIGKTEGKD